MFFLTYGNVDKPKALIIHPMFASGEVAEVVAPYLSDYYVISPTLDGHDLQTDFTSVEDEANKISDYVNQNGYQIEFIYGMSLGALIAFNMLSRGTVPCKRVYLDGGPFFKRNRLLRGVIRRIYLKVRKTAIRKPKKYIATLEKQFKGFGERSQKICGAMSDGTIDKLADACCSFTAPDLPKQISERAVFFYGGRELAALSSGKIKKYKSRIIRFKRYGHCAYAMKNTQRLVDLILEDFNLENERKKGDA